MSDAGRMLPRQGNNSSKSCSRQRSGTIVCVILAVCMSCAALVFSVYMFLDKEKGTNTQGNLEDDDTLSPVNGQLPNILMILADDLGYHDIGYQNPAVYTPTLDYLASTGRILTQHYAYSLCTPSRAALLTGMYSHRTGMQTRLDNGEFDCLPTNLPLLPELLKAEGYSTHLLGKWHLGYCQKACLPTRRGWDTAYGFLCGQEDKYEHTLQGSYAWFDQTEVDYSVVGTHEIDAMANRAEEILDDLDSDSPPFFMLFSAGIPHEPLQAPQQFKEMYREVHEPRYEAYEDSLEDRQMVLGMISHMDARIKTIVDTLRRQDLYNNTVIIFTSDNGGDSSYAFDNYPFRGCKGSMWEGGQRTISFVHSPLLDLFNQQSSTLDMVDGANPVWPGSYNGSTANNDGLMHITDWFTTLLSFANASIPSYVDGLDQTNMILDGGASVREEVLYSTELAKGKGRGTLRVNNWKLIWGKPGRVSGWGVEPVQIAQSKAYLEDFSQSPLWSENCSVEGLISKSEPCDYMQQNFETLLNFHEGDINSGFVLLYDLNKDPRETTNLASDPSHAERILEMKHRILKHLDNFLPELPEINAPIPESDHLLVGWCGEYDLSMEGRVQYLEK